MICRGPSAAPPLATPPAERSSSRLCFLGPLDELVALGLYRPALEALCRGDEGPLGSPLDRTYLRKILGEEVGRQFGHPLRPIVELVLNGVDAGAGMETETCCRVDVSVEEGRVTVTDSGKGMSFATILSRLLVPFSTDKVPGVDLGRFGVGFFSALGFGIADPTSFSLQVETGDGLTGWAVCVNAAGPEATDLTVSIRATAPRSGTRVKLSSALLDPSSVRGYLRDMLHFFPAERAGVWLDGTPLNDGSQIEGGKLYEDRAEGAPGKGRFHLGGRGRTPGLTAATYHAGVKVEACYALFDLALLDFPAAVELTEGRDALKPGPMFAAFARAFYRRLIAVALADEGPERDLSRRHQFAELAAQISALMLKEAPFGEVAREIADALLGPDRFLVNPDRAEVLIAFLGPAVARRLFSPESFWAERQWQTFLPGERELLEDELVIDPPLSLASLARARPDLAGLGALVARSSRPETQLVSLTRGKRGVPAGPLPCLGGRRGVLLREDAAAVRAPSGWRDLYALRTAFDRAAGLREADVERDLIVAAPLGQSASSGLPRWITGAGTRGNGS